MDGSREVVTWLQGVVCLVYDRWRREQWYFILWYFSMSLFLNNVVVGSGPGQGAVCETDRADAWSGPEGARSDDWPMGEAWGMADGAVH